MANLALDEQETNYTIEATDRKTVNVFSNDSVTQRQMERLGIAPHRSDGYGKFYTVDLSQFSFGIRRKRQISDEQRAALGARLAEYRSVDTDEDEADGEEAR